MKNKIISFLSASILVFLFSLPNISMARPGFAGGDGSEGNPYQITTCEQLQIVTYYATEESYFILNNDIDCSMTSTSNSDGEGGYYGFMPIGYTYDTNTETGYGDNFVGHFDGNNHTISGLYINRPTYDYVGLFGNIGGSEEETEIKDVNLTNVDITGHDYTGGLVGFNFFTHIENTSTSGGVLGNSNTGGLVGMNSESPRTIDNSHSSVEVEGYNYVGGLVGYNTYSNIYNSYATGDVLGEQDLGGLIGYNRNGHIENTYATGNISGVSYSGGLIGATSVDIRRKATIVNSYATGDISVDKGYGGGLVGYSDNDKIYNSFAVGAVSDGSPSGGLIGELAYISGSYTDFIFNSGWYKTEGSELLGIGSVDGGSGQNVSHTESDPTAFYSSNHDIYKNAVEYDWEFNGNPWYEYSDDYPKFTEPDSNSKPSHSRVRSSGSSVGAISTFYQEQYQRALAVGADTTPYQEALNNLNPSTSSGQAPSTSSGQTTLSNTDQDHRTLKQGMQGNDVKQLQIYLNTHNYPLASTGIGSPNNETTYFGKLTKQAVILFQKANNLTPDGIVGPLTWSYIK